MLLMTKYSNEVSFIDMVTIPIQLNNFKCRRFIWTPFAIASYKVYSIETRQGKGKIIGFFPTNQITLYLLHWFCSDIEIITVCCRPTIWALIGWGKTTQVAHSLLCFYGMCPQLSCVEFTKWVKSSHWLTLFQWSCHENMMPYHCVYVHGLVFTLLHERGMG